MSRPYVIQVFHTRSETDFGDYHSWTSSVQASSAYNDKARVMAEANEVASKLRALGLDVSIEIAERFNPFPKEM